MGDVIIQIMLDISSSQENKSTDDGKFQILPQLAYTRPALAIAFSIVSIVKQNVLKRTFWRANSLRPVKYKI